MKKVYIALLLTLSVLLANAQTYDKEFSVLKDTSTFAAGKGNPAVTDFTFTMQDTGICIINCLPKQDPFSFIQMWLGSFYMGPNPYIQTCVASDVPVGLTITANYVGGGSLGFGKNTLTGSNIYDTLMFKATNPTKNFDQLMLNVDANPCTLYMDWFRMGVAAHPIQVRLLTTPQYLPSQACTLKVSKVFYYYSKSDPISKLICTATTTSAHLSDIKITESPSDTSFIITFNTDAAPKGTICPMTVNLKDLGGAYSRSFSVLVTITTNPVIGVEETPASDLSIFPNPVLDKATVTLPDGGGQLSVVDAAGRTIMSLVVQKGVNTVELNTSALAAGTYSLVFANDESLFSKRFKK